MKILITGGEGYVGSALVKALSKEYEVTSLTRKDCDLTDKNQVYEWFHMKYFDLIIHTACEGGSRLKRDTAETFYNNVKMFHNLYSLKDIKYKRFIQLSSGAEVREDYYGFSKKIISDIINYEKDFQKIMIYGLFNENEEERRFIKANVKRYIKGDAMMVDSVAKYMDFFYMDDFIEVIKFFIENEDIKNYSCCYENKYNLEMIADIINNLSSKKVKILNKLYYEPHTLFVNENVDYVGSYTPLPLKFKGLEKGIEEVYEKLKNEEV